MELFELNIEEALTGLKEKKFTSEDLVSACLLRAEKLNPKLNIYLEIWRDSAIEEAREIDKKIAAGEDVGPLAGIPIALKDNLLVSGRESTSASKILKGHIAAYDATVVKRLRDAGAIFIGRTNMDEFAMGSSTENSAYGPTLNPWDSTRVPGGSSGGSAAAVAAQTCLAALGSDTGGSIRQPASFCGVVGLKPTYGRVSRYGLMAMASSLDQIGPFTKTVKDAARILQVIEGDDPNDSTSVSLEETIVPELISDNIKGLKIGVPKEYFIDGMDPEIEKSVRSAIEKLKEMGAEIKEVSLPYTEYGLATYYVLMPSEVSANLARYDGVRYGSRAKGVKNLHDLYTVSRGEGFGNETRRRIMLGTYALSSGYYDAYYKRAGQVRTLIANDFREVFKDVDVLVTPTSPVAAFKVGERFGDPLTMYLADIFTVSANIAGVSGVSIPCGFVTKEEKRLPIGLQFLGKHFGEEAVLRAANAFEKNNDPSKNFPEF